MNIRRSVTLAAFALAMAIVPMSTPAQAATPIVVTISNLNVSAGDNFLPDQGSVIPAGYTNLQVQLDLSQWTAQDDIFVFANYSTDGGQTWADEGGVETNGGTHLCKDGVNVCQPGFNVNVPEGTNVMVRAHYIVPTRHRVSGNLTLT